MIEKDYKRDYLSPYYLYQSTKLLRKRGEKIGRAKGKTIIVFITGVIPLTTKFIFIN